MSDQEPPGRTSGNCTNSWGYTGVPFILDYHHTGIPLVFRLDIQFFSWCLVVWVGLGDLNVIGFLKKSMVVSGSPKRW